MYVRNISMSNAQNGARIKVFGGSNDTKSVSGGGSGYVKNITFEDFRNISQSSRSTQKGSADSEDVDNPIYLTQCYSTPAQQCEAHPATREFTGLSALCLTHSPQCRSPRCITST